MQQDSVDIISKQLLNFYHYSSLYYICTILHSTSYNQTKQTAEIYNDPLANNLYSEVMQLMAL